MNTLSNEIKNQVIIFHDGSKKFITNKQAEAVMNTSTTPAKGIKVDGSFITFGSIAKILTVKEFYEQYPNEQPAPTVEKTFPASTGDQLTRILSPIKVKEQRISATTQMMKGLKQYIIGNKNLGTGNPENLYKVMEARLELIYDNRN